MGFQYPIYDTIMNIQIETKKLVSNIRFISKLRDYTSTYCEG